jgi:hypothetical protein
MSISSHGQHMQMQALADTAAESFTPDEQHNMDVAADNLGPHCKTLVRSEKRITPALAEK